MDDVVFKLVEKELRIFVFKKKKTPHKARFIQKFWKPYSDSTNLLPNLDMKCGFEILYSPYLLCSNS